MKILILSCSTGEGHNSAAKAVRDALTVRGAECVFMDPIIFKSEKRMHFIADLYNNTIAKAAWLFGIVYRLGKLYDATPLPSPVAYANSKYSRELAEYIAENRFDAVVCSHLYAMQAMVAVREKHKLSVPTYCILTDYTVIPFHKDAKSLDAHFAPTAEVARELVKKGIPKDRIYVTGIPANPKFNITLSKSDAKKLVGIPDERRAVMLLSGGAGCGSILKLCRGLDRTLDPSYTVLVFPGKNEKLKARLEREFSENGRVRVVAFTPDVNIYMKASDAVLSKPGGLSSTEIASANLPFVHLKAIPGCETYNIRYFTSNGLSLGGTTVKKAVRQTKRLLEDKALAENMLKKQRELIPPDAADRIAETVLAKINLLSETEG